MLQDYDLLNQIGEGSFGRVYKARYKYTGSLVAIKFINKTGQSEDDLESLRREIALLRKVNHPNIMRIHDVIENGTNFYIVSELARGDLFQIIDDDTVLPETTLKEIAAQLVSSLAHLHSLKIIHRDMKPQNILISAHGSIKICDFGFARALSQTTLVLTSIKGTPLYMAPELVQEQPYNEKIDIWSLGIILYELFHGRPPYYTESIYKLVQMIMNNPIEWPESMSGEFKGFLMRMLEKDPANRASAEELLKDPFIADVDLKRFDDAFYMAKSAQFKEAITKTVSGKGPFQPKKQGKLDYQMIFFSPSSYGNEDLAAALKYLIESEQKSDSLLLANFAENFEQFLQNPAILDQAMEAATYALQLDRERFTPKFVPCMCLFKLPELPSSCLPFFTELLTIPYCFNIVQNEDPNIKIPLNEKQTLKLRDRLVGFLFMEDLKLNAMTFLAYLVQTHEEVTSAVCGSFAGQIVPKLVASVIEAKSPIVQCAAFSILAIILSQNQGAAKMIQPISDFVRTVKRIVDNDIVDLESFCVFSALLSFIAMGIEPLAEIPEFGSMFDLRQSLSNVPNFVNTLFKGNKSVKDRLNIMLMFGTRFPETTEEVLCYIGNIGSPFIHLPLTEDLLDTCVNYMPTLIPIHQEAVLKTIFGTISKSAVVEIIPDLCPLLGAPSCTDALSTYCLDVMTPDLAEKCFQKGALISISNVICELGPSVPPNTVLLLVNIILSFRKANETLLEESKDILNSVFALHNAAESSLMIASHFARLSAAFIPTLSECGALNLAERELGSDIPEIRARSLDFIGNFSKHGALPEDFLDTITQQLVLQVESEDPECQKMACFALSNVLFFSPEVAEQVADSVSAEVLVNLMQSDDPKTVENAAAVCGNLVRKSASRVEYLINAGILGQMVQVVKEGGDIGGVVCKHLSLFCQHERARTYLSKIGAKQAIIAYTTSSDERLKRIAQSMVGCLS